MPILNRVAEMQEDVAGWRRHLHEHPELLYDVFETSKFVAEKLTSFGCDVVETGIGKTGVVGIIKGRHGDGPTIGFRSDMDALPILETSGKPWASKVPGKAHSCGHDGHTAMLLGAAQYLAETRNFKGSIAVIFQPAEEGGAGALACLGGFHVLADRAQGLERRHCCDIRDNARHSSVPLEWLIKEGTFRFHRERRTASCLLTG